MTYLSADSQPTSCLIKEACCNNTDAERVCEAIIFYTDLFDNAVDKDVHIDLEHAGIVWVNVLTVLSFNSFWAANKVALAPLLIQGMSAWLDSEKCSHHPDLRVRQAGDVLKSFYLEFLFHVGCICGGYGHMRKLSQKWRGFDFDVPQWERAIAPRVWDFPLDHSSHPTYKTEWWYFSGTVSDISYHVAFFRHAETCFAHASFVNHETKAKVNLHKVTPDLSLSGALNIQMADWEITQSAPDRFDLRIADVAFLEFKSETAPVLQGEQGLSHKGPNPGEASHYYSMPRLRTSGSIGGVAVEGESWFDHEFSTDSLPADVVGWDWFAIRFPDGGTLMAYLLRKADGSYADASTLVHRRADGFPTFVQGKDIEVEVLDTWHSPASSVLYPIGWSLKTPVGTFVIGVRTDDQEYIGPEACYYEGGVTCSGDGEGHAELTGYANPVRF